MLPTVVTKRGEEEVRRSVYFVQFDGIVRKRTFVYRRDKDFIRTMDTVGRLRSNLSVDAAYTLCDEVHVPYASLRLDALHSLVDGHLQYGWLTSLPVAIKHRPRILFDREVQDEESKLIWSPITDQVQADTGITYWEVVWGTLAVIVIGSSKSYAYNRDMNPIQVHSAILEQCRELYGAGACIKGVIKNHQFYQWEMIALDGKDVCSDKSHTKRIPLKRGSVVLQHNVVDPWDIEKTFCLVTCEESALCTVYGGSSFVRGVWLQPRPIQ